MASYLRFSNQDIQELDPSRFKLSEPGLHVFTTFASHLLDQSKLGVLRLDLHLQRVINGAKILAIDSDLYLEAYLEWFEIKLIDFIRKDYIKNKCSQKIRIILRENKTTEIYIEQYLPTWSDSVELKSHIAARKLAGIKHTDFQCCIDARKHAEENFADEGLLITKDKMVLEGAWSNIFWFDKNNKLYTTEKQILPGITREIISKIEKVNLSEISLDNLCKASEVFLTQSTSGITAVKKIDHKQIKLGEQTKQIKEKYNTYLRENITII